MNLKSTKRYTLLITSGLVGLAVCWAPDKAQAQLPTSLNEGPPKCSLDNQKFSQNVDSGQCSNLDVLMGISTLPAPRATNTTAAVPKGDRKTENVSYDSGPPNNKPDVSQLPTLPASLPIPQTPDKALIPAPVVTPAPPSMPTNAQTAEGDMEQDSTEVTAAPKPTAANSLSKKQLEKNILLFFLVILFLLFVVLTALAFVMVKSPED